MNYYHITWVSKNSRINERMAVYKVKIGEAINFNYEERRMIYKILINISKEIEIRIEAINILSDHVHILIKCNEAEISEIVRKLKSKSTYIYKKEKNIQEKFSLWAQKYNESLIKTEKELEIVKSYIINNHLKHKLEDIKE